MRSIFQKTDDGWSVLFEMSEKAKKMVGLVNVETVGTVSDPSQSTATNLQQVFSGMDVMDSRQKIFTCPVNQLKPGDEVHEYVDTFSDITYITVVQFVVPVPEKHEVIIFTRLKRVRQGDGGKEDVTESVMTLDEMNLVLREWSIGKQISHPVARAARESQRMLRVKLSAADPAPLPVADAIPVSEPVILDPIPVDPPKNT